MKARHLIPLFPLALAHPTPDGYDTPTPPPTYGNGRAEAVVDVFRASWAGYYEFAFPHDELKPVTDGWSDSRNGWGASAIDALSTAVIMDQADITAQILEHVPRINWAVTGSSVSLFETTIRYLGGLLSGYDLLSGPMAHMVQGEGSKEQVDALLAQAVTLADNLSYAFETPSGVPYNNLDFGTRGNDGKPNGLATTGTLILEWTRLADLSGNKTYAALVERAESYLLDAQPAASEPFPGLLGMDIDPQTGRFLDARGGWVGGADSYYEYLIKMFVYDPSRFAKLRDAWIEAADSTIEHLASHPEPRPDLTFLAGYNGTKLELESEHLACFDGGNFILGGLVLGKSKYIDFGLDLVAGCRETYKQTATGIGPEVFAWNSAAIPEGQHELFERAGFYITNAGYQLRPEVIESYYYAYRATGDAKYQEWAWEAFVAINATTRIGSGYSSIKDVNVEGGGGFTDFQESFWFAEVLKYSYLIQTAEGDWQVGKDGKNAWVYNTEAHPVKVVG